jgi:hypothetical protein
MGPPPTHVGPRFTCAAPVDCNETALCLTIRRRKASSKQIDSSSTDNIGLWQLDGPNKQQVRSWCVLSDCVRPFNWRIECRPSVGFVHHKRLVSPGNGDGQPGFSPVKTSEISTSVVLRLPSPRNRVDVVATASQGSSCRSKAAPCRKSMRSAYSCLTLSKSEHSSNIGCLFPCLPVRGSHPLRDALPFRTRYSQYQTKMVKAPELKRLKTKVKSTQSLIPVYFL